jgi:hypothetical protein
VSERPATAAAAAQTRGTEATGAPTCSWSGSILFGSSADSAFKPTAQPAFFGDLDLDQVCAGLTEGRQDHDLAEFFYLQLHEEEAVEQFERTGMR